MQLLAYRKGRFPGPTLNLKLLLAMKFTSLLLLITTLQLSASGFSQGITITVKNAPLESIFKEVEKQTVFRFVYTRESLSHSRPVSINVKNETIENLLRLCFVDQPLSFVIEENFIIIKIKQERKVADPFIEIRGKVINEQGEPMAGATIKVKNTNKWVVADDNGEFILKDIQGSEVLVVSYAETEPVELRIANRSFIEIKLKAAANELDQVVMTAYGQTTRKLNTGNIAKVTSDEIGRQPVSNALAALEGRVPGLLITQTNGYAGSAFSIRIRGQNSLLQGSEPLFIIDGVPLASGNENLNQVSAASAISPFYVVNPADIESIEVLKDADATAIYGSRGANGVILITTKKGIAGKTKLEINGYTGFSRITRSMDMLNTQQYIQMRKEAQFNDGVPATISNSADILVWDTLRYTDFKKMFIGNTATTSDLQIAASGGQGSTQFRVGIGYHQESTVLPTDLSDKKLSGNFSFNHTSPDKRFKTAIKTIYSFVQDNLPYKDMASAINNPPNMSLYDSTGNLNWQEGGVTYRSVLGSSIDANPLSILKTKYRGEFQNLSLNLQFSYLLHKKLNVIVNSGFNTIFSDETRIHPSASLDPYNTVLPYSYFGNMNRRSWIAEPQLEYLDKIGIGKLRILGGVTWQENISKGMTTDASNYTSDLLLNSISGAGTVKSSNTYRQYRYFAMFGTANYNIGDKYLVNLSGREDGSSRFGPGRRFNLFGAVAGAWIFSNERVIADKLHFISYGKLRGSYGTTGNDQIRDYLFLDTWNASSAVYLQTPVILPSALFNPVLAWEETKKLELALELGFFKNRLQFSLSYFRNRSGNQLINYALPVQTGFSAITRNFDALVQNKGFEVILQGKGIGNKKLEWNAAITLTVARNKLLKFPGLETSSYATDYIVGQPVSVKQLYHYLGVDPATGVYTFADVDRNGSYNRSDRTVILNVEPEFYGGMNQSLRYKNFRLDVFFEFRKQLGNNYLRNLRVPGYRFVNQPLIVLNRWQNPGEIADIQKFTATTSTLAYKNANSYLDLSDAAYTDASFIRCKNLSIDYALPAKWLQYVKMGSASIYVHAQNLFVLTRYVGSDPENQNIVALPPLRTIAIGIHFNF
jgi:TonB-linked SusC/RagA family outer membrane protein